MRWFFGTLSAGWAELLRILREHFGRSGTETEGNMTLIFWVCAAVLLIALGMVVPPQVLLPAFGMTALLVVLILSFTKRI